MPAPRKPTDKELLEIGQWSIWAFRQPNALDLFRERGASCPHGTLCPTCFAEARTRVAQMANDQEETQG